MSQQEETRRSRIEDRGSRMKDPHCADPRSSILEPHSSAAVGQDDPRVIQALDDYFAALEAGQKPDRRVFLARHAEVAEALAKCLDGLEFIQKAAPQLDQQVADQGTALSAITGELATSMPLGDFRIIREIGRGGMGVVYEAEQLSLGRRVALKVLPFAAALDSRQLQRFKNEAQAAAHLHHTNIVPVFGVGCERGVHFYAMQYIEGQTLAAMIRQLRQETGLEEERGSRIEDRGSKIERFGLTILNHQSSFFDFPFSILNLRSSILVFLLGGHSDLRHHGAARSSGYPLPGGVWGIGVFHETLDGLIVRRLFGEHALLAASLVPGTNPRLLVGNAGRFVDRAGRDERSWDLVVVETPSLGTRGTGSRDDAT
jgi:hypothetical protein